MKQTFLNSAEDCKWLRETHLAAKNINNCPVGGLDFKSFCLFGNEDSPEKILTYSEENPTVNDKPIEWTVADNGKYSGFCIFGHINKSKNERNPAHNGPLGIFEE